MTEFYIRAESFAAPFCSDSSEKFVEADTPSRALVKFVNEYRHPAGLYSAAVYKDANAYAKRQLPFERWLCNHELKLEELRSGLGCYSVMNAGPGKIEFNGKWHEVKDPKGGRYIRLAHQSSGADNGAVTRG